MISPGLGIEENQEFDIHLKKTQKCHFYLVQPFQDEFLKYYFSLLQLAN